MKILLADEMKMTKLAVRFKELKGNIKNESAADKETRTHLGIDIAAIKKTNSLIVGHYLNEHILSSKEIERITKPYVEE